MQVALYSPHFYRIYYLTPKESKMIDSPKVFAPTKAKFLKLSKLTSKFVRQLDQFSLKKPLRCWRKSIVIWDRMLLTSSTLTLKLAIGTLWDSLSPLLDSLKQWPVSMLILRSAKAMFKRSAGWWELLTSISRSKIWSLWRIRNSSIMRIGNVSKLREKRTKSS